MIWATYDTARLVGLPSGGPAGCGAWLPVRWRGLPGVLHCGALYGLSAASTLTPDGAACRSRLPGDGGVVELPALIPIKGTAIGADRWMQMQKEQANKNAQLRKALELLPSEPIPAGQYLVHNDMTPTKPLGPGLHGFRAWIQTKSDNLVRCRCRFGGCKNSEVHKVHYRVDRGDKDASVPSPDQSTRALPLPLINAGGTGDPYITLTLGPGASDSCPDLRASASRFRRLR